ncbi:hypothetical protein SKAU_G00346090 [Synaphobranchus kaupii]|uniref:Uncharacterized protein n=1 Tax=Synaphobranchus kaupii TaxID=118154 RepID=A0A9Q1IHP8_SYNKA|nr:hypothetical protein SKAU_G00346090 [Synaphobranchus kaupii]
MAELAPLCPLHRHSTYSALGSPWRQRSVTSQATPGVPLAAEAGSRGAPQHAKPASAIPLSTSAQSAQRSGLNQLPCYTPTMADASFHTSL